MNYEKIVTLYDTTSHANAARQGLEAAGFPASEISVLSSTALALSGEKLAEPGVWQRVFGRDIKEHEAGVYGRVVASGGAVVTVRVPETDVPKALAILNTHAAVDVQHRAMREGLLSASAAPAAAAAVKPATLAVGATPGEEVLALAEEQLTVGKRLIQEGTTRIRRFIVETPVEKQITLHEEHVHVVRRAISDPESLRNVDWGDKVLEFRETVEEPVISKSAHIAEEVVIQKEATDQVKTLKDKLRRQQVEVERIPGGETASRKG